MSRFLKLTHTIVNKHLIHHVEIQKDKFIIHTMSNKFDAFLIFGGGAAGSHNTKIELCKTDNFKDYITVANWIDDGLN